MQAEPVALVLCSEKIREDAERTLAWFREQGVRCRVISGDNPVTVGAIARRVKLTGDHEPVAMDARELPEDVNELARVLENVDVLGRVLPDQKKAIVQALHTQNHVVAMTGDGVNDALAIKEADLGIAMGNAAPATKAVAQVVLVDSKFSHLPDVVARGRQVMANMERVASLFLVKTVYSALISLGVVLTQIPYPYLPRHITYIGALTIGMPAFILALAPNTRRYIPGFLKRVVTFALPGGIATALSVLLAAWVLPPVMGWNVTRRCRGPVRPARHQRHHPVRDGRVRAGPRGQTTQRLAWRAGGGVRGGGRNRRVRPVRGELLRPDSADRRHDGGHADRVGRFRADLRAVPVAGAARARTDGQALASALRRRRDCLILQADTPEPR